MSATVPSASGRAVGSSKHRAKSKRSTRPAAAAVVLTPASGKSSNRRKRRRSAAKRGAQGVAVAAPVRGASSKASRHARPTSIEPAPASMATAALKPPAPTSVSLEDWRLLGLETADRPRLTPAGTGDHQAIYQFLLAAFQSPPHDIYMSSLDDPLYEPTDRLLIKRRDQVLAHARIVRRVSQWGSLAIPVAEVVGVSVLPEFRGQGFGRQLLQALDRALAEDGAEVATLRTGIPQFFGRAGWSVCGRHSWSRADARELAAQFLPHGEGQQATRYIIRPWRQVELPALVRLYSEQIVRGAGAWQRTEAAWRWLLGRKSFSQLLIAIDGPDKLELDEANAPIVGYLVLRDDQILELVVSPDHPQAARELIARACGEGMERYHHYAMTLHAPADHPAHDWFVQAGGVRHNREADQNRVGMARVLDPARFLRVIAPVLHERAETASLERPLELGLAVGRDKFRLIVSRRSVKLGPPQLGRSYLSLGRGDFTRLLLGHLDIDQAIDSGKVVASTRIAREAARALFPQLPLWRSPFDEPLW